MTGSGSEVNQWDYLLIHKATDPSSHFALPIALKEHVKASWSITAEVSDEQLSTHPSRSTRHPAPAPALAEGWSADFIDIKRHIVLRGREPILPEHYKWDFRSLPDGLFCSEETAFLRSLQGKRMIAIKALEP